MRLYGIDAPEAAQPHGPESSDYLRALLPAGARRKRRRVPRLPASGGTKTRLPPGGQAHLLVKVTKKKRLQGLLILKKLS